MTRVNRRRLRVVERRAAAAVEVVWEVVAVTRDRHPGESGTFEAWRAHEAARRVDDLHGARWLVTMDVPSPDADGGAVTTDERLWRAARGDYLLAQPECIATALDAEVAAERRELRARIAADVAAYRGKVALPWEHRRANGSLDSE